MRGFRFATRKSQKGLTSVEFSIIGGLFFVVLFAVIEFGRLMFVMNMLDEVTRRGARLAAVCPVDPASIAFVQERARFNGGVIPGLDAAMVDVGYLEMDGTPADLTDPVNAVTDIYYVRVRINGFNHRMLIPTLNFNIPMPDFSTTIPSESLGVHPDGSSASCT